MAADQTPHVPRELVDWLSERFPERCPEETATDRAIWIEVGFQKAIKKLRKLSDNQSENVLHDQDT